MYTHVSKSKNDKIKAKKKKQGWRHGSRYRVVWQVESPEFKSHYHQKQKREERSGVPSVGDSGCPCLASCATVVGLLATPPARRGALPFLVCH
jgi:hypothetical protein